MITLTEKAADHIRRCLKRRGKGLGIRVAVKTSGCSGLAYKIEYADQLDSEDCLFEEHGVKLIVHPHVLPYVDGSRLDYTQEGLNEGFRFENPNVKSKCGCGESFSV